MVRPSLPTLIVFVAIAALGFVAVAAVQRARTQGGTATASTQTERPTALKPQRIARTPLKPLARVEKASSAPKPVRWQILQVRSGHSVSLRSRPGGGGQALATVDGSTEFGSPTTLSVVKQRGAWLGVTSTLLPNGTLGWVKAGEGDFKAASTRLAIRIDLSERRLQLVNGKRVVRSASVAVGRPGSSTPTGRFQVTDKLQGSSYGPYYGCCVLALSGKQPHLPAGWTGGDRLAIHGTDAPGSVGLPSSAGCLRARDEDLHPLMRRVPLGTPVFIRS